MANFPQNPSADDTHQIGDKIWTWDGEKWFADYDALSPVFQAITAQGMVDTDAGSDFKLALDADILSVLNNPAANTIGNVTVTGDQSPVVGNTKTYSFNNDGTLQNNLVGTYTCTVPGSVVVLNTVEFTQIGTGKVLVEVNHPDATDAPVTAEMDINVVAVPTTIGLVTIDSDSGNFSPDQGDVVTYSYTVDGDAVDYVGVLSALGAGASVSGDTVTWTGSGQAEVRYDVTSATAADSPRHNTEIVNVAIKPNIGDITLSGNTSPVVGTTENYTAFYNGTATGVSSQWTADPALGATPDPIIPGGFDFSGSTVGATGDITVTYTSGSAWDSPKSESITVTVAAAPPPGIPITGDTSVDLTTATDVDNPDQYAYAISWSTTNQSWSVESDVFEWIPVFNHSGTTADCEITNSFAMFDGDETRPTTFDWKNTGTDVVRIRFNKDVFPSGTHNLEILVQETTGDKIGFNLTHDQDNVFTQCPAQVCLVPTWLTSTRAVNWKDHFLDIIINNETYNSFLRIFAIKVDNQIIRLNRPVQAGNSDAQIACFYFGPANYKVKCTFKNNGYDYDEELDVTATGYPPLITVTPRTAPASSTTYTVTVTNTGYGNKYVIDGVQQDSLTLTAGNTYIFDQSDSSNSGHPLKIYTDSSKSTEVTAGVTIGSNSTTFVPGSTGTYSYQCAAHANMGGDITVQ